MLLTSNIIACLGYCFPILSYVPAGVVSFSGLFLFFFFFPFLFSLIRSSGIGSHNDVTICLFVFLFC